MRPNQQASRSLLVILIELSLLVAVSMTFEKTEPTGSIFKFNYTVIASTDSRNATNSAAKSREKAASNDAKNKHLLASKLLLKTDKFDKQTDVKLDLSASIVHPRLAPKDTKPSDANRMPTKRQIDIVPSKRNEDPWFLEQQYPPQPYRFVYNVKGKDGQTEQYRQEVGDGKFLTGSYGYVLPDGIYRHVDYVADDRGFRAYIRTSEPGTANDNPANVVIDSKPVSSYASYSDWALANGYRAGLLNNYYFPYRAPEVSELTRRPTGSIVNTPARNFSSFSFTTPSPLPSFTTPTSFDSLTFGALPPTSSGISNSSLIFPMEDDSRKTLRPQMTRREPWQDYNKHFLPLNYNRIGYFGNTFEPQMPSTTPAPYFDQRRRLDFSNSFRPAPQNSGLKIAYDKPLSIQGDPPALQKLPYDDKHIIDPESHYLSLERARSLAQLNQLNTAGRGLYYIRPLFALDAGTLTPTPSRVQQDSGKPSAITGSFHHGHAEEHHEHHEGSQTRHQDGDNVYSKEHQSGVKIGSSREFEIHHNNRSDSNQGQLAPPMPVFQQQPRGRDGVKGYLQAPYASIVDHSTKDLTPLEPVSVGDIKSHHRSSFGQMMMPAAPSPPSPPPSPPSPSPPEEPTKTSPTDMEQQQLLSTKSDAEIEHSHWPEMKGATKNSQGQHSTPIRLIRMPEEFRASMMMNDLRSMQNTLGLPQPPRHQSPDHIVSARLARVDALLSSNRLGQNSSGAHGPLVSTATAQSSTQKAVAVHANELNPVSRFGKTAKKRLEEHRAKLSTGPMLRLGPELTELGVVTSNASFEALRLSRAPVQSEKVSELEKFQQRLKTQQLLLEQSAKNADKLANRSTPAAPSIKQPVDKPPISGINSQVSYDEDSDSNLIDKIKPSTSRVFERDYSRPRRQNEPTSLANSTSTALHEALTTGLDIEGSHKPTDVRQALNNVSESTLSKHARQIQHWPSLNISKQAGADSNLLVGSKLSNKDSTPSKESKNAPETGNTINLDFINSVTALSVDQLNPFAISSVNPAVQRSSVYQPPPSGQPGGVGVATASARYFNSPELLAALDEHRFHELGGHKSLSTDEMKPGWPSNHRSASELSLLATQASSMAPTAKIVRANSSEEEQQQQQKRSFVSTELAHRLDGSLIRDGFEVRDRALQVDNQRFYEVVSSSSALRHPNENFKAFRAVNSGCVESASLTKNR